MVGYNMLHVDCFRRHLLHRHEHNHEKDTGMCFYCINLFFLGNLHEYLNVYTCIGQQNTLSLVLLIPTKTQA